MPKGGQSLASMSVEALISLRENVALVLRERGAHLRQQLQRLEIEGRRSSGRKAATGTSRGGTLPPKYRDTENPSNLWAGRGAIPRWMAERIKKGAKREDFLIGSSGTSPARKKRSAKKTSKPKAKPSARGRAGAKTRTKSKVKAPPAAKKRVRKAVAAPNAAATPTPSSGHGGQV
jgi:DNA-binding protein H-NS